MRLGRRTMLASDGSPRRPPEPTPPLRRELRSAENNSRHRSQWGVLGPPPFIHPFSSRPRDFYAIRRRRLSAPPILLSDRTSSSFFFFFFLFRNPRACRTIATLGRIVARFSRGFRNRRYDATPSEQRRTHRYVGSMMLLPSVTGCTRLTSWILGNATTFSRSCRQETERSVDRS